MAAQTASGKSIRFKIGLEGKPDKELDTSLYAFDQAGAFIAAAPVRSEIAELAIAPERLKSAHLYVAPTLHHARPQKPTNKTMAHLNAYAPLWRFEAGRDLYELHAVPELLWKRWIWCSCRVRGRVTKINNQNGTTFETPVCHARVHICEVDRIWWVIARLPDPIVLRMRDELLKAIEQPTPVPKPAVQPARRADSGLLLKPETGLHPAELLRSSAAAVALNPQPEPPGSPQLKARTPVLDFVALNPQPLPPKAAPAASHVALRNTLMSRSVPQVRDALLKNVHLIWPYWCWWDWLTPHIWPFFYSCDPLTVVETDESGRFDTTIWYLCGDTPDLYFWIEYAVGGVWTTVYHPSMRCHTHWNYACGTEVTIQLTDPRVHGCGEPPVLPGSKIVVKTIGRNVSMGEIYRAAPDAAKQGLVKEGWIHPTKPSPFGATLEPRVDFGTGLAPAITHYRWSYRTLGSTSEADWGVIDAPVSRHYRETTPPGHPVVYKSVQIAPDLSVSGYYAIINPALPAGGEAFEILDEGYDLASAYLDTVVLTPTPGSYELKLELFHKVGTVMTRIDDLVAAGVEIDEIDDPAPLTAAGYTTVAATGDRLALDPVTHKVIGYRLVVQVDNRQCFGAINDVTVNAHPAGQCGFLEYHAPGDSAYISFRASHPADFAAFSFDVVRVSTTLDEASVGGLVGAASVGGALPAGGDNIFARSADTFAKTLSVNDLLTRGLAPGETPCIRAAFAEALSVWALATNGYGQLSGYDAPHQLKAFAITPA